MRAAGSTLAELLFGIALGLAGLTATTSLLRASLAAWERAGAGREARAAMTSALEQIARDIRLAGYDPRESGIVGVVTAGSANVQLQADLDGNGSIDPNSEERVSYRRAASGDGLQRVVGAQSMPLLSGLASDGFRVRYFDGAGLELDPEQPATTGTVREIRVELGLARTRTLPAVRLTGGARILNR